MKNPPTDPNLAEQSDLSLWQSYLTRHGHDEFELLVRRHLGWVTGISQRILQDHAAAQDVAQETFAALVRKAPHFKLDRQLLAWLHTTALHLAQNQLHKQHRREQKLRLLHTPMDTTPNDENALWTSLVPHLESALGKLSKDDRGLILQRYYEGRSYREMSLHFPGTDDAIRKRVQRSLEKLSKILGRRSVGIPVAVLLAGLRQQSFAAVTAAASAACAQRALSAPHAGLPWVLRPLGLSALCLVGGIIVAVVLGRIEWGQSSSTVSPVVTHHKEINPATKPVTIDALVIAASPAAVDELLLFRTHKMSDAELLVRLQAMVAVKQARIEVESRIATSSGQRRTDSKGKSISVPINYSLQASADIVAMIPQQSEDTFEGTEFTCEPIVGEDDFTIDLTLSFHHDYAPSTMQKFVPELPGITPPNMEFPKTFYEDWNTSLTCYPDEPMLVGIAQPRYLGADGSGRDERHLLFVTSHLENVKPSQRGMRVLWNETASFSVPSTFAVQLLLSDRQIPSDRLYGLLSDAVKAGEARLVGLAGCVGQSGHRYHAKAVSRCVASPYWRLDQKTGTLLVRNESDWEAGSEMKMDVVFGEDGHTLDATIYRQITPTLLSLPSEETYRFTTTTSVTNFSRHACLLSTMQLPSEHPSATQGVPTTLITMLRSWTLPAEGLTEAWPLFIDQLSPFYATVGFASSFDLREIPWSQEAALWENSRKETSAGNIKVANMVGVSANSGQQGSLTVSRDHWHASAWTEFGLLVSIPTAYANDARGNKWTVEAVFEQKQQYAQMSQQLSADTLALDTVCNVSFLAPKLISFSDEATSQQLNFSLARRQQELPDEDTRRITRTFVSTPNEAVAAEAGFKIQAQSIVIPHARRLQLELLPPNELQFAIEAMIGAGEATEICRQGMAQTGGGRCVQIFKGEKESTLQCQIHNDGKARTWNGMWTVGSEAPTIFATREIVQLSNWILDQIQTDQPRAGFDLLNLYQTTFSQ